jgi:hypothetical protein
MGSTCARHLGRCGFDGEILIFDVCWILFGNPVEFEVVFFEKVVVFSSKQNCESRQLKKKYRHWAISYNDL